MRSLLKRGLRRALAPIVLTVLIFMSQQCFAAETLLSGFEGDLSTTLGLDWQDDSLSSSFVSTGATQGSQALAITHPRTQSIPLKLFGALDTIYDTFTQNTQLKADFTLPATADYREAFFRLQVNGGAYTIDGSDMVLTPGATVTGVWDYQSEGVLSTLNTIQPLTGFSLQLGMRGPDIGLPPTSVTIVDNIRWFSPSAALLGDYNGNDEVDAADYTVWRDALDAGATELLNDPTPGVVNESDFTFWREHFGESLGSGAASLSATVPEPSSLLLALTCLMLLPLTRAQLVARS